MVGEKSCGFGKHGNVLTLFHVIDHPQLSGAAVNEWLKVDLKAAIHVKAGKDSALTNVDVNWLIKLSDDEDCIVGVHFSKPVKSAVDLEIGEGIENSDLSSLFTIGTAPEDPEMRVAVGHGGKIETVEGSDLLIYHSRTEAGWSGGLVFAPPTSGGIVRNLVGLHAGRISGPKVPPTARYAIPVTASKLKNIRDFATAAW